MAKDAVSIYGFLLSFRMVFEHLTFLDMLLFYFNKCILYKYVKRDEFGNYMISSTYKILQNNLEGMIILFFMQFKK